MIRRALDLVESLRGSRSAFLFGPRGTGKSTLAQAWLAAAKGDIYIDLLRSEQFRKYAREPERLRQEVEFALTKANTKKSPIPVVIDEIQRVPDLLNEIHSLLESYPKRLQFLMTGSSARKLKRGASNLLGGRAVALQLGAISSSETKFSLERALSFGTLPVFWELPRPVKELSTYVDTFLREEILQEALIRKADPFTRFLDVAGAMNGQTVNHKKLAAQCGASDKTVRTYYEILVDTLIFARVDAYTFSAKERIVASPKYYTFDCGVLNALNGELRTELRPATFRYGVLFENWCVVDLLREISYRDSGHKAFHYRTYDGLEVDLVLSRGVRDTPKAIEIKSAPLPREFSGLRSFKASHPNATLFCIADCARAYQVDDVRVVPWRDAAELLLCD
jgi:uncharacterized protein